MTIDRCRTSGGRQTSPVREQEWGVDVYQPLHTMVHGDDIVFIMSNTENSELVHVRFPIAIFDDLTDAEVTEQVTDYCIKHADHVLEGPETNPTNDPTRDTRMATFVNDTLVI